MKMHRLENYDPDGTLRDSCESTNIRNLISIRDYIHESDNYTGDIKSKIIFNGNRDLLKQFSSAANQYMHKNKLYEFIYPDGEVEYMILTRKQYVEELTRLKEIHGKKLKAMDIGKYLS